MAKYRRIRAKCPVNGKLRYHDRREATGHLHWLETYANAPEIPCRAYPCEHCKGWHLTSKPNKARNEITP